jgi:hypothetical protein
VTRHFMISDSDGKNPRHVTLAEYLDAIDRGDNVRLELFESNVIRPAPASLSEAAQALADC